MIRFTSQLIKWAIPRTFVISTLLFSTSALAARPARVDSDQVPVYEFPKTDSKVIETLQKNDPVAASNELYDQYYKVKTPNGKIGFVSSRVLFLLDPERAKEGKEKPVDPTKKNDYSKQFEKIKSHSIVRLRALGGFSLFKMKEMNALLGFDSLSNGAHYGGEVLIYFSNSIGIAIRLEQIKKNIAGRNSTTLLVYDFQVSSFPVQAGLQFDLLDSSAFTMDLAVFGGVGLQTELLATDLSQVSGNVTRFSANPYAFLVKSDLIWHPNSWLGLGTEIGYRYLKTDRMTPDSEGTNSSIFKNNGENVPTALDFSGVILGAILQIKL